MKIILLERVLKLGQMGDVVKVKDGYARNYLLPTKKALRATKANIDFFATQKVQLEAQNLELKKDAEQVSEKLEGKFFMAIRQSADSGQLYGSVSTRDIAKVISDEGFTVTRNQVMLDRPVKTSGIHDVKIVLHPEVIVNVHINIARTEEEAINQEKKALTPEVTAEKVEPVEVEAVAEEASAEEGSEAEMKDEAEAKEEVEAKEEAEEAKS